MSRRKIVDLSEPGKTVFRIELGSLKIESVQPDADVAFLQCQFFGHLKQL